MTLNSEFVDTRNNVTQCTCEVPVPGTLKQEGCLAWGFKVSLGNIARFLCLLGFVLFLKIFLLLFCRKLSHVYECFAYIYDMCA